jgi:hypothetical protein
MIQYHHSFPTSSPIIFQRYILQLFLRHGCRLILVVLLLLRPNRDGNVQSFSIFRSLSSSSWHVDRPTSFAGTTILLPQCYCRRSHPTPFRKTHRYDFLSRNVPLTSSSTSLPVQKLNHYDTTSPNNNDRNDSSSSNDQKKREEEAMIQWELFQKYHAPDDTRTTWKGIWTTYNYMGDKKPTNNANDVHRGMIEHTHTIVIGATQSDCKTCFDTMETKDIHIALYQKPTDLLDKKIRLGANGLVMG